MRISCPNCSTEYDVPNAALAGRSRMMRCVRCGHQWRGPAPDVALAPLAATAELQPVAAAPAATQAMRAPLEVLTWPEALEAPAPNEAPLEERTFGQPVDRDARAALQAAAISEGGPPLNVPEPEENTAAGLSLPAHDLKPVASEDRFAELFRSAQDRASIYESEEPPPPAVKISSKSLVVVLVILLVLAMIFLEREHVMHAFPASAKLFHSLGFS